MCDRRAVLEKPADFLIGTSAGLWETLGLAFTDEEALERETLRESLSTLPGPEGP